MPNTTPETVLNFELQKQYSRKGNSSLIYCKGVIEIGSSMGIYGKSGIGKSSILRMLAGLDLPDKGFIQLASQTWYNDRINIHPSERKIGFVFQDYNLFDNMTVQENLNYVSQNSIPKWIESFINKSELQKLKHSYPSQLSGGEKQRFSILRAICQKPNFLFLDEPFSALDDDSIDTMINFINQAQTKLGITIVIVSHRKDILHKMTDSVIHLMSNSEISQGTPKEILYPTF